MISFRSCRRVVLGRHQFGSVRIVSYRIVSYQGVDDVSRRPLPTKVYDGRVNELERAGRTSGVMHDA